MEISVAEVKQKLDAGESLHLIDVREPGEVALCMLKGAEHIAMLELFTGMKKTSAAQDQPIVVYCHTGIRSMEATMFLRHQGFTDVRSMAGGIERWACEIDPAMARY